MTFPFPRWRALLTALLTLAVLVALAMTAVAASQTTPDPDDPYDDGLQVASDLLAIDFDRESQPGKVVLRATYDYVPNARFGTLLFFDIDGDDKADRTLDVTDYDFAASGYDEQQPTRHGQPNQDGVARYRLRTVSQSTLDCQTVQDSGGLSDHPSAYPSVVADNVGNDTTVVTIPLDVADLGATSSFRWALVAVSQVHAEGGVQLDFVPDAVSGATDQDGQPANPRGFEDENGDLQPWFSDPSHCNAGMGSTGKKVRMAQGVQFALSDATAPEVTIEQSPAGPRPNDMITFTANVKDNRAVQSYAWDLDGDGEYDDATGKTAQRAYPSGGRRFVRVRVTDTLGLVGTGERTVDIIDAKPSVSISQAPTLARPNRAVTLSAPATDDGQITAHAWDLDDDGEFDDGAGATVAKTFTAPGSFRVSVRVTDDAGNETVARRTIEVAERAPTMTLTTSKANPNAKEKFTLHAEVVDDGEVRDADIKWGFELNPGREHLDPFDKATGRDWTISWGWPGKYTMKAQFTDDTGKTVTERIAIDVANQAPAPRDFRIRAKKTPDNPFNTDPLLVDKPILMTIGVTDDGPTFPIAKWDLDADGDFDDATGLTIEHVFKVPGEKPVKVKLEDHLGLTAEAETQIEIRETVEAECAGKVEVDGIRAVGCFKKEKDGTRTTKEPFKINGLGIEPRGGTTVKVNPLSGIVDSGDGFVTIKAGDVVLYEGRWKMDPDCDPSKQECLVFKTSVPEIAKLKGLPLKGEAEAWRTPTGTRVRVNVDILGTLGVGATAKADLFVTYAGALQLDELEIRSPALPLPKNFSLGQFFIKYNGKLKRWAGGGYIVLPTPMFTRLEGDFAFSEITGFERMHGEVDGLSIPVDPFGTIYLQRIAFTMEIKGSGPSLRVRLGGGLGMSFGPRIGGMDALTVDGDFLLTLGWPLGIDVEGRVSTMGYDIMGASVGARTNGSIDLHGSIGFGLPFPTAQKGVRKNGTKLKVSKFDPNSEIFNPFQIITVKGEVSAWAEPDAFSAEGSIAGKVIGITLVGANGLLSSKGVAGCGELVGIRGGFGYEWVSEKTTLFGDSCDLSPWEPDRKFAPLDSNGAGRQPEARAAQAGDTIDVAPGQKALMVKVDGVGGDPLITLVAPDGRRYEVPSDGMSVQHDDWFSAKHPRGDETYIGVRAPVAGAWRVELQQGSPAIKALSRSKVLPEPSVKATVRGSGRTRTIDYVVKEIPGQTVEFAEDGSDTHRTVGVAKGAKGSVTFVPQLGTGRSRALVAQVKQGGLLRKTIRLGRFMAPVPARPAPPAKLRARRGKSKVTVAWNRVAGATQYHLIALSSDGKSEYVQTKGTSAVIPSVGRDDALSVRVTAVDKSMRGSFSSRLRLAKRQLQAPRRPLAQARRQAGSPRFTG